MLVTQPLLERGVSGRVKVLPAVWFAPMDATLHNMLETARRLQQDGQLPEAIAAYRQALARDPSDGGAWFGLGQIAFTSGNVPECIELVQRAISCDKTEGAYYYYLGVAQSAIGRHGAALRSMEQSVRLRPAHAGAQLKLGLLALDAGERERAARACQRAVLLDPRLQQPELLRDAGEGLQREVERARKLLRQTYAELLQGTRDALALAYPGQHERMDKCLRMLEGAAPREYCHPQQRPEFLLMPDMQAQPWFDPAKFDWLDDLRAACPQVREEMLQVLGDGQRFEPYVHGGDDGDARVLTRTGIDITSLAESQDWTAFHLMKGEPQVENCALCPATTALMGRLPLANATGYVPDVLFSMLQPGAHIQPHYGQNNVRLTVHMGLEVPADCDITVGGETRTWESGEVLVFDDSFLHEATNRSAQRRVVLIFKVWNPFLSDAERFGIEHFFANRERWLKLCEPDAT